MATVEISRTLIKSASELWADLESGRLGDFFDEVRIVSTEAESELAWEAKGVRGRVSFEPSGFGTKVTVRAEALA